MWGKKHLVWAYWQKDILARNVVAARFLSAYLKFVKQNKVHLKTIEVIDLQRYKRINKSTTINQYIREKKDEAFIFFVSKN